jgi:hypothetical protein
MEFSTRLSGHELSVDASALFLSSAFLVQISNLILRHLSCSQPLHQKRLLCLLLTNLRDYYLLSMIWWFIRKTNTNNKEWTDRRRNLSSGIWRRVVRCLLPVSYYFLPWLTLQPWRQRQHAPPKRPLTNGLYGVETQKPELFISTTLRTWNPTTINDFYSHDSWLYLLDTPITVATLSKTWSVFARSNAGPVGSYPA